MRKNTSVLIKEISKQTNVSVTEVQAVLESFTNVVKDSLNDENDSVMVKHLGVFKMINHAGHPVNLPVSKKSRCVDYKVVKFIPTRSWRVEVKKK